MPRPKVSEAARILNFFQTAPGDSARIVADLVADTMRRRFPATPRKRKPKRDTPDSQSPD